MKAANQMTVEEYLALQAGGRAPTRVQGGRDAQSGGKAFEAILEQTHAWYRQNKIADIDKLPVATAPMPRAWIAREHQAKGGMARILSERQRADYFGVMGGDIKLPPNPRNHGMGCCIQMEAKSQIEAAKSLPITRPDQKGYGLKAHQLEGLVRAADFGALVAVVWRNGPNGLVFGEPVLRDAWNKFRLGQIKRLEASDATPYPVKTFRGFQVHDWLGVA